MSSDEDRTDLSGFIPMAINIGLGRLIGVVPFSVNRRTYSVEISIFWRAIGIIICGVFLIAYPIALYEIFTERKIHISGIWFITELVQYASTYLLTAVIYFKNIFDPKAVIEYMNNGFHYSYVYENRLRPTANQRNDLLLQFVFRSLYSNIGFIYSNFVRLAFIYDQPTRMLTIIYYLPDIVITSAAIRFMTSIMMQLQFYRRLNEMAQNYVDRANAIAGRHRTQFEWEKVSCELSNNLDWLCDHHIRLRNIGRATERLLSQIVIFSIVYAFANLASCVSVIRCSWGNGKYIDFCFVDAVHVYGNRSFWAHQIGSISGGVFQFDAVCGAFVLYFRSLQWFGARGECVAPIQSSISIFPKFQRLRTGHIVHSVSVLHLDIRLKRSVILVNENKCYIWRLI